MPYGDVAVAKAILDITGTAEDTRLASINDALSAAFDAETGQTFSPTTVIETREIETPGVNTLLVLPERIRSVTAIETGGTWDGTAWTGGTVMPAADYRLVYGDARKGYHGIAAIRNWTGTARITGAWADVNVVVATPKDVVYVVTYAIARQYRAEKADNDGMLGPDGFAVQVPQATNFGLWTKTVEKYRVPELAVV